MMKKVLAGVLALLLAAACIAWLQTVPASLKSPGHRAVALNSEALVDESVYVTAQRLAQSISSSQEQSFAQTTLRLADHELVLAFTAALSDVESNPPQLTPEALRIQERQQKSLQLLDADQHRVADLTHSLDQASAAQKDSITDELELAQSQLELDKDEVEEANQDLLAAGGNPQQRIAAMVQEHDAQLKTQPSSTAPPSNPVNSPAPIHGALHQAGDWLKLRQREQQLGEAADAALRKAEDLRRQRSLLTSKLDDSKAGISELASHSKNSPNTAVSVPSAHSHADAAALLTQTKVISAGQKLVTLLDRQVTDLKLLASVYQQWSAVVVAQATAMLHGLLLDAAIIAGILLAALLMDSWSQRLLNRPKWDRRQVETLRSIARIGIRVVVVVAVVLILVGPPGQIGTVIGIVGAGLTVALKDFIVAFFGWLVLMGRNGIRLGDWVEINGVSGEVIELGMFHSVLLETGNWSDAGHPTGRRVTFTNSFAIEGHYFNFSTSGQWLWDELHVVVPSGQDPYPLVQAISKEVTDATADNASLAEQEWQRAVPRKSDKAFSGAPGINVKPIAGGVEISIRYITRAHERFQLRAKLYRDAVDLLGRKPTADA